MFFLLLVCICSRCTRVVNFEHIYTFMVLRGLIFLVWSRARVYYGAVYSKYLLHQFCFVLMYSVVRLQAGVPLSQEQCTSLLGDLLLFFMYHTFISCFLIDISSIWKRLITLHAHVGAWVICVMLASIYIYINPLTAVSVYVCPDHFNYTQKIVQNQLFVQKSRKIH